MTIIHQIKFLGAESLPEGWVQFCETREKNRIKIEKPNNKLTHVGEKPNNKPTQVVGGGREVYLRYKQGQQGWHGGGQPYLAEGLGPLCEGAEVWESLEKCRLS